MGASAIAPGRLEIRTSQAYLAGTTPASPTTLPHRQFEPCIPTRATVVPAGPGWLHEIKHDGFRLIVGDCTPMMLALLARPSETVTLCNFSGHLSGSMLAIGICVVGAVIVHFTVP
jgi:ATP-dependent DNA ligase